MSLRRRLTRRRRERSSTVRAKGQSFRFGERPLRAASPLGRADPSRTTVEGRFVAERRSTDSIALSGVVSFRGGAGLGEGLGSQSFCRRFGVVPRRHPSDVVLKAFPCHSSTVQRCGEGRGVPGGTSQSSVLRRSWIVRHAFRWERLAPSFVTERTKNGNLSLSKDV